MCHRMVYAMSSCANNDAQSQAPAPLERTPPLRVSNVSVCPAGGGFVSALVHTSAKSSMVIDASLAMVSPCSNIISRAPPREARIALARTTVVATPQLRASASRVLSRLTLSPLLALNIAARPALEFFVALTNTTCLTPRRAQARRKSSLTSSLTTTLRTPLSRAPGLVFVDANVAYGPNRPSPCAVFSTTHTTGTLATMSCMAIASPSSPSAFVTRTLRLGRSSSTSSSSSSASSAPSDVRVSLPSFASTRAEPSVPTEESEPYQRRSLRPPSRPSMTSSKSERLARSARRRRSGAARGADAVRVDDAGAHTGGAVVARRHWANDCIRAE
mmetsp:Transcript_2980/g.10763  ORF Transcript_2980/g.10763 Transcript_2980/m.10763 type:complete len:331 (-) Transcript_2980:1744-2736(-)